MSVSAPFAPCGNTVVISATTTASAPVQVPSSTLGGNQYRIINAGSVTVFLGYGIASSDAANNSPVVTTTGPAYPLLAGTDEILTFVPNAYFTGTTSTGTANIYITPGDGM